MKGIKNNDQYMDNKIEDEFTASELRELLFDSKKTNELKSIEEIIDNYEEERINLDYALTEILAVYIFN
ncbi:hypothetical protein JW865_01120 [Candidatus Bathyarchaeota archaeon]|nr:hypothetical protein [Candidatus Bathyarchaeota archaeon]